MKNYETVFIMTPVLTEKQVNDSLSKVTDFVTECGGNIIEVQNIGLKKLAYKIRKKSTGVYLFMEFGAEPDFINKLRILFNTNGLGTDFYMLPSFKGDQDQAYTSYG